MATRRQQDEWSRSVATRDPIALRLLVDHGPVYLGAAPKPADRFAALARSVCFQQLAGAAATTIWGRVQTAIGGEVTPESVLTAGESPLRSAGLSGSKTTTIVGLAHVAAAGDIDLVGIGRLSDERVIEQLTQVRGIGRWTAEMFLMFSLHRPDVWPTGDYGVRTGYGMAFGVDPTPTAKELDLLGEHLRPHRSVVAWWCWRELDATRPQKARPQKARPQKA